MRYLPNEGVVFATGPALAVEQRFLLVLSIVDHFFELHHSAKRYSYNLSQKYKISRLQFDANNYR